MFVTALNKNLRSEIILGRQQLTEAGSFSGGEFFHLSRGFMFSNAGVALLGISMVLGQLFTLGEVERGGLILPLRRAFASQLVIWVLFRPVWWIRLSFSSSVG